MATLTLKKKSEQSAQINTIQAVDKALQTTKVADAKEFRGKFALMRHSSTGSSLRFTTLRETFQDAEREAIRLRSEKGMDNPFFIVMVVGEV